MTSARTAKAKGSCFEYDCHSSLLPCYPNIFLTKQRGFQLMYDLQSDQEGIIVECKRLKGISWNQLAKFHKKLEACKPSPAYRCFVLFKSNHQPCLVFTGDTIQSFETFFCTPFIKHEPVKRRVLQ